MKRIVIPSILAEGVAVVEKLLAEIGASGFSESACFAVRLALDEALANAIRHGNGSDASKKVTVDYDLTDEAFTINICDEGPGFAPEDVPDPTLDENLERPCGRGVMLMRAYMTSVGYNDKGNCVSMVKRKDCPLPHSS